MRREIALILLGVASLNAAGDSKNAGSTTLKDAQPAGVTDKKHKHQQFDQSFSSSGRDYSCRTDPNAKVRATDIPVGSSVTYEIKGDKGKLKSSAGKNLNCKSVRVANTDTTAK